MSKLHWTDGDTTEPFTCIGCWETKEAGEPRKVADTPKERVCLCKRCYDRGLR